jgi:hypothetical protein
MWAWLCATRFPAIREKRIRLDLAQSPATWAAMLVF